MGQRHLNDLTSPKTWTQYCLGWPRLNSRFPVTAVERAKRWLVTRIQFHLSRIARLKGPNREANTWTLKRTSSTATNLRLLKPPSTDVISDTSCNEDYERNQSCQLSDTTPLHIVQYNPQLAGRVDRLGRTI